MEGDREPDCTQNQQTADTHRIFHKDPADYMQYVNREVRVEVRDGTTHTGRLYTIDPVSESLGLVTLTEDGKLTTLQLIVGHSIQGLTVLNDKDCDNLDSLFKTCMNTDRLSQDELCVRKETLCKWLLKNRLPVETRNSDPDLLCLSGALVITPPYGSDNCQSTNEIILSRVQGLIRNMPHPSQS